MISILLIYAIIRSQGIKETPILDAEETVTVKEISAPNEIMTANLKFDFGSESSPVAESYIQVANTSVYSSDRGFGFSKEVEFRDRETPDDLLRDFVFDEESYHFFVDLPNGEYLVHLTAGDACCSNTTSIEIEGEDKGSLSSRNGEFSTFTDLVVVTDGQMEFKLSWRVNSIEIFGSTSPTGLHDSAKQFSPKPSVTLKWDSATSAIGYNIYRTSDMHSYPVRIGSAATPEFVDGTIELGFTYQYWITQVIDGVIESIKSDHITVSMADDSVPVPKAPANVSFNNVIKNAIQLSWDKVNHALMYYIYRSESPDGQFEKVGVSAESEFIDHTVLTTNNYYYKVAAVNAGGISETAGILAFDAAPSGLSVADMTLVPNPTITLTWNEVDYAHSYNIYRKIEKESKAVKIGSTSNFEFEDDSAILGFTYQYMVTQISDEGDESNKSRPLIVTVADESISAPAAPADLKLVNPSGKTVEFTWSKSDNALFYYVYKSETLNGPFEFATQTDQPVYEENDANLFPTSHHYYKVYAVNLGGISEASEILQKPITYTVFRQMEHLDRGLIAIQTDAGVYVGWRLFGTDPKDISFNIYRDGEKINLEPITTSTNYLDQDGQKYSAYSVSVLVNGEEQSQSAPVKVWDQNYIDLPLQKPEGGTTPDDVSFTYHADDVSVGDLDGDGEYEIVMKWEPSNAKDNSQSGYTGEVFLDAYKLDGTLMWRIRMGKNIRAGSHYTQFMVYDLDGDGASEIAVKTADGTIDGLGNVIGDPNVDYRGKDGRILEGPEYLTIFEGQTGKALVTTDFSPARGKVVEWGDSYGNRVDRFLAAIAYLDGQRPSLIMARGYYEKTMLTAYNWRDGKLTPVWTFDSDEPGNEAYAGQGNHNLSVGDVDGDGKDEIIYGAMAIDDDGTGLYSTGLGHGDSMHMGDLNPARPGLEVFQSHEYVDAEYGLEYRDADSGEVIWGIFTGRDIKESMAADIDPRYAGAEVWSDRMYGLYSSEGVKISDKVPSSTNFGIWWDGDLLRELLDDNSGLGNGGISKWDYDNSTDVSLMKAEGTATKDAPNLQADLFGDWREEVIWRTEDNSALRIYTTTDLTEHRIYTLMHDPIYRLGVAWQNVAYNQPPHTSFFLGHDMDEPPIPHIYTGDLFYASVKVDPLTLNLKSGGRTVATSIELPAKLASKVGAAASAKIIVNGAIVYAQPGQVDIGDHEGEDNVYVMVKFDRQAVINAIRPQYDSIDISIIVNLEENGTFIGHAALNLVQ